MTAAEITDREIRSYLLAKGRSGVTNSRVRIKRNGEVHVFGPLRNGVQIGWFFAGSRKAIAEKIALERIDDASEEVAAVERTASKRLSGPASDMLAALETLVMQRDAHFHTTEAWDAARSGS